MSEINNNERVANGLLNACKLASNIKESKIELLPHNQMLYDKIVKEIEAGERSIFYSQATGLGKSFIFMRLVQDYFMDKKILYIVPKIAIWNNLTSYSDFNKLNKDNIEMATFASFNIYDKSLIDKYDVVFIDECHHMLSDIQGNNIGVFINDIVNQGGYAFGLTATPEYKGIFVDEKYFDVSCYGYDVYEAIEQGIFPKIKLALAGIDLDEVPSDLKARFSVIGTKTLLERILDEHKDANKWLVYFPTKQELNDAVRELNILFPDFKVYKVYNEYGKDNEKEIEDFSRYNGKTLLLSVSMLLEGIHLPKVDGILLYRNVTEFTTYMQIYGRLCNMYTKDTPVFVDISNAILKFRSKEIISKNRNSEGKKYNPRSLFDITAKDYWTIELAEALLSTGHTMWTEDELNILRDNYNNCSIEDLMVLLPNRTENGIRNRASIMGLTTCNYGYTEEQERFLKENYYKLDIKELCKFLDKDRYSITHKARQMGLYKSEAIVEWSDNEINIILSNPNMSALELSNILPGRGVSSIYMMRSKLGISKSSEKWTDDEDCIVKEYWDSDKDMLYKKLSHRTKGSINSRASTLGLCKGRSVISKEIREFILSNQDKLTLDKLSEETGLSKTRIRTLLRNEGITKQKVKNK